MYLLNNIFMYIWYTIFVSGDAKLFAYFERCSILSGSVALSSILVKEKGQTCHACCSFGKATVMII